MRIKHRIRRVPGTVAVGTACAAALAAWAGASAMDTTDSASARDDRGGHGRQAKNVVLFIGDGMGAAHRTFFREALKGHAGELATDSFPVAGLQHTDPEDPEEPITDSAASGTPSRPASRRSTARSASTTTAARSARCWRRPATAGARPVS